MKMTRGRLQEIVLEEFWRRVQELNEASVPPEDEEDAPPSPEDAPEEPTGMPELGNEDLPDPEELPQAEDGTGGEEDEESLEDPLAREGSVAAELEGKTIESISMDEKSKMMPGAAEVVISFRDSPDALRILLTKTGKFKFFYNGLHSTLDSAGEAGEGEGGEDSLAPDDVDDVPGESSIVTPDTEKGAPSSDLDTEDDDEEDEEIKF